MKKITVLIIFLFVGSSSYAQVDVAAGMGIDFTSISTLQDYININFAPSNNQIPTFHSSFVLFSEGNYSLNKKFQLGFEYVYTLYTYNTNVGVLGLYDISLVQHKPSVIVYYVFSGKGYRFKFGGGLGPRIGSLTERLPNNVAKTNYTAYGVGYVIKAEAHTLLSRNFYAMIGGDIRLDYPGIPKHNNKALYNSISNMDVNVNSFTVGVKLGISYYF